MSDTGGFNRGNGGKFTTTVTCTDGGMFLPFYVDVSKAWARWYVAYLYRMIGSQPKLPLPKIERITASHIP